jgi:hypothetical protein
LLHLSSTGPVAREKSVVTLGFNNGKPYVGLGLQVDINLSEWNSNGELGNSYINAAVLLHEMGHVYNDILGSGGSQIGNDTRNSGKSQANTMLILQKCFPGRS